MLFWTLVAAMTAFAVVALLLPFIRRERRAEPASTHDAAVYKDQLSEISKDLDHGLIDATEAEAARAEIARRLIRAAKSEETPAAASASTVSWHRRLFAAVALIGIPAVSVAFYLSLGSPDLPDQPLSARATQRHGGQDVAKLIEGAENYLKNNPKDGNAWALIAPVYLRVNQGAKAAHAFRRAIDILGSNVKYETGLGEALVAESSGQVTPDAVSAFERALKHDPKAIEPRFFIAVALNQNGKFPEAVTAWEDFLKDADPRQPWVPYARRELARAQKGAGVPVTAETPAAKTPPATADASDPKGPTADQMAAAQDMEPEDRQAMIEGMVSRLAERLNSEGGPAEDWIRLMRAYMVLKRSDEARSAAEKALAAHKDDAPSVTRIKEAASGLGITL